MVNVEIVIAAVNLGISPEAEIMAASLAPGTVFASQLRLLNQLVFDPPVQVNCPKFHLVLLPESLELEA